MWTASSVCAGIALNPPSTSSGFTLFFAKSASSNSDNLALCNNAISAGGNGSTCSAGLVDGDLNTVVDPYSSSGDPLHDQRAYYYDLRISSRITQIGNVDPSDKKPIDSSTVADAAIGQDSSKDLLIDTAGPNAPTKMWFYWTCDRAVPCIFGTDYLFVTLYRTDGTTQDMVFKRGDNNTPRNIGQLTGAISQVNKIKIKAIGSASHVGLSFINEQISINAAVLFRGSKIKIQSIGYYGSASRKLEADVDRSSGALLGLFDYAVYAGSTFTQPQ